MRAESEGRTVGSMRVRIKFRSYWRLLCLGFQHENHLEILLKTSATSS